jgi:hypothetical protein
MKIRFVRFNIYFILLLIALGTGCETTDNKASGGKKKKGKEASTLRLHLEVNADGTPYNSPVPVYRADPVMVNVNKTPFLNEGDIQEAQVVETVGGFALRIQFDPHGLLVLDSVTGTYRGSRIAILSHFTEAPRWIAAPRIAHRITDGVLTFTPDATREEAERIARGLNNVAIELEKQKKPEKKKK